MHHLFKPIATHTDPEVAFREQNIPVSVRDHLQGFIESPENLSERIAAGPPAQTAPERWSGFEVVTLPLKAMGSTASSAVSFQHEHLMTSASAEGCATQTTDTAPNHDHLSFGGH